MAGKEPRAHRPAGFPPGYKVPESESGMKPWRWATDRLEAARNYWLATTRPSGAPHAMPVWGLWLDGTVVFSTAPDSVKARNLDRDARAVIHVALGDDVVILEGEVERIELDAATADLYAAKYDYRPEPPGSADEGWYRFRPRAAYAWADDFPRSVTRFDLG
ncbi:MAG TPA: pyridoxamine 5'-phosphate oxidase family protein [Gaiellaceae bacterium]|nr:pyridoxamine 5'-phosphate oxidase family protein [Gaiellaceae bacterium]